MTSVLDAIVKLPRYIKVRSTNGIENNAIVLDNHHQDPNYERKHTYYETHKEKLTQYFHKRYLLNKKAILQRKKEYNQRPEVKARCSEYHKNYYQDHKAELKLKHKKYSKNRTRKKKKHLGIE